MTDVMLGLAVGLLGMAFLAAIADLGAAAVARLPGKKAQDTVVDALIKHGKDATE